MRRKIVLWGSNEKDEKILVALELLEKENVVDIYTFPESVATEAFYKEMSEKWKDDVEIEFPAGFTKLERKLSVSDSILPDEIKVDRPDLITRAQAEWHFVVLSSKLYGMYRSELEELKEKIDNLSEYDNVLWEELRNFWGKVQAQVSDKNLFREHGASLREKTNHLFDKLKEYKKAVEDEFETQSKKYADSFRDELGEIENKIDKGMGLSPLFEDLKKIQSKFKDFKFTKEDRNELWNKIDETFKKLKEKRGAHSEQNNNNNNLARLQARYDGLIGAIHKMQKSIDFDQKDLDFQAKKVADSDGQLESQLRQAKIRMIEERIKSKQEKMDDMQKTKAELESRLEKEKRRSEKAEKMEEAKQTAKQKIASSISDNAKEMDKISEKLEKAASEMPKQSKKESNFMDKISESMEQLVEDVVDTAKAIAEVAGEKLDDLMDEAEKVAEKVEDKIEDVMDKAEVALEDVSEKVEDKMDKAEDIIEDFKEKVEDKIDEVKAYVKKDSAESESDESEKEDKKDESEA